MKRFLSLFMCVWLLAGLLAVPAYAAKGVKNHEHTLDEGTVTLEPTCYQRGWITYTCTDPDCTYTSRTAIPATGHDLVEVGYVVEPTCTGLGEIMYKCQNPGCIYSTTHIVSYLGHRMEFDHVISEPDCTHAGLTVYLCSREGCHGSTIINFPPLGHRLDEGTVAVAPTCTSSGIIEYHCTREGCTYVKSQWVAPLPHTWDDGVVALEPTEYAWGRRVFTCTECGATDRIAIPPFSAIFRLGIHAGEHYYTDPDLDTTIRADGELNFHVILEDGWKAGDDFAVTATNGQIRQESDGSFTVHHVEADTKILVSGIVPN